MFPCGGIKIEENTLRVHYSFKDSLIASRLLVPLLFYNKIKRNMLNGGGFQENWRTEHP